MHKKLKNKFLFFLILIFLTTLITLNSAFAITCSVKNTCSTSEHCVISMSSQTNAHATICGTQSSTEQTIDLTGTSITFDGFVGAIDCSIAPEYDTRNSYIKVGFPAPGCFMRGFMDFDTTNIPDDAIITSATLKLEFVSPHPIYIDKFYVVSLPQKAQTLSSDATNLYNSITKTNTQYASLTLTQGTVNITLNQAATNALKNNLLQNWFSVGFVTDESTIGDEDFFTSSEGTIKPKLTVTYTTSTGSPTSYNWNLCCTDLEKNCELIENQCYPQIGFISLSSTTNAHAALYTDSAYSKKVCCTPSKVINFYSSTNCQTDQQVISLSAETNAHVAEPTFYPLKICASMDTTLPTVQITNPKENDVLTGINDIVTTASDTSGISMVEFYIEKCDGTECLPIKCTASGCEIGQQQYDPSIDNLIDKTDQLTNNHYVVNLITTYFPDGTYDLIVVAFDGTYSDYTSKISNFAKDTVRVTISNGEAIIVDRYSKCEEHPDGWKCVTVTGSGIDECSTNDNCGTEATHYECDINNLCSLVDGVGPNECTTSSNCGLNATHYECDINNLCSLIEGAGFDACTPTGDECSTLSEMCTYSDWTPKPCPVSGKQTRTCVGDATCCSLESLTTTCQYQPSEAVPFFTTFNLILTILILVIFYAFKLGRTRP